MTAGKPYQRSHAEALLKPVDDDENWVIDDRGVWPAADFDEFDALGGRPEYEVLAWKPVWVFKDDRPAPDYENTPALPFPFDAGDLAAFMLAGTGSFVADYYGSWEHGPDEDVLDEIAPGKNYARHAVRDAYDAYRAAIQKVGEVDHKLKRRAEVLDKRYRRKQRKAIEKANLKDLPHVSVDGGEAYRRAREQALEPLASQKAALERARADAEGAQQRWLRAMVEELLKAQPGMAHAFGAPNEATPAVAPEPVVNSASNVPDWTLTKPRRYHGYTAPLHRLLADAHGAGNPCPKARDVMEAWRSQLPAEIAQVLSNEVSYYDAKGDIKTANTAALQKTINRLTKPVSAR